jgi:hypothetical protein
MPLHGEKRRLIIPQFVDTNARLAPLRTDEGVVGVVSSLLGDDFDYAESDGNILDCETSWHCDVYGSPMQYGQVRLWLRALPEEPELRDSTPCLAPGGKRASRLAGSPGDNSPAHR